MPENNKTFKIGLCLAGAVSAGAYTAGVIDYLLEALDQWQKRKDAGTENTPSHQVEIPLTGGASAGGMTGIILASVVKNELTPIKSFNGNLNGMQPENILYHSWVDMLDSDMLSVLLDTSDIGNSGLESMLNSNFIEKIADRAFENSNQPEVIRKYISNKLKVFVTLSNLEGMEYPVDFKASTTFNKYKVVSHSDYACFKLCESESDYGKDGWIPLNFKKKLNTDVAKASAMGTGAFPVGLKARVVSRKKEYMNQLDWFFNITKEAGNYFDTDPYTTMNVDGGMINNEPFEKVFEELKKEVYPESHDDIEEDSDLIQDSDKFKSTVLLIDPFPSESEPNKFKDDKKLAVIMGSTLGAMIDQSRLKPERLIDAFDAEKAGQFLIAPVRYFAKPDKTTGKIEGQKAIACGNLGGFSGFLNKEFRVHDYFLGRANCERFLRHHFVVPADTKNKIFVSGYSNLDKRPFTIEKDGKEYLQIIPVFTPEKPPLEMYMPTFSNGSRWPSVSQGYIESYRKKIKNRVEKVIFNMLDYSQKEHFLLWVGAKVLINGKIADVLINKINNSLKEHGMLE